MRNYRACMRCVSLPHWGIDMHWAQTRARKWDVLRAVWTLPGQKLQSSAHISAPLLFPGLTTDQSTRGGSGIRVSNT